MLQELRVGEQRLRAVWEVLDGASVIEVARRFGVSRQSVHVWLRRYAADQGLGDRSSRPHGCPHQMRPVVEARIVEIRRAHPVWGADRCPPSPHLPSTSSHRGRASGDLHRGYVIDQWRNPEAIKIASLTTTGWRASGRSSTRCAICRSRRTKRCG
jgi:transposase-like protein